VVLVAVAALGGCRHAEPSTVVVVSTVYIRAGTPLDPLIAHRRFRMVEIPNDLLVPGVITSIAELRGQTAGAFILPNEQISESRISG